MYDWPELHWATDTLWSVIAARLGEAGIEAPAALDRARPRMEVWTDPRLLLSQTCGWPFATRLIDKVRLVGTPVYDANGCIGPTYCSFIITRRSEKAERLENFHGRRFGINGSDSLSGYVALRAALRDSGLDVADCAGWTETGSHRASVRAVAAGETDVAAIDSVCWALARRFEPDAVAELKVIARTPQRPGLPLITGLARSDSEIDAIRAALKGAIGSEEAREARQALMMQRFAVLDRSAYEPIAGLG
jgi:ABC-type phosphate/phosphonate transport system substrate-binding protein